MSYTPTSWQTGDTITAEKLNNIESGIEAVAEPFIVTLTPTAQDFSGVMDKTMGEIKAAYKAGQRIVFRVIAGATSYLEVPSPIIEYDSNDDSVIFYINLSTNNDMIVVAYNSIIGDSVDIYSTTLYPLTPMS